MTVIIKKNTKRKEIKEALKKIKKSQETAKGKGYIAHLFGSNPKEVDGIEFQKKVRSEWQ